MARLPDFAQGIVALDVGPWFGSQRQSLRRLYRRRFRWIPVDQAVQQVQDMGLRRDAGLQRQFDGGEHGLFVMLEDQGQNLDHLAVAARRLEHALLQSPEGGRQFDERRAVTQGSRLALNDREIVPPVVNRCGALPFMGAGKNAAMLAHDLPLGDDDDGQIVCEHRRVFARSHERKSTTTVYDWRHYLAVIQRKPGALRNGAPFVELPPAFRALQQRMLKTPGGDREMVEIL